ncbi:MAG: molybdopterin-binding protein [Gammaproteobacteria bacterium]|nr:molybdopterin-binding protein [Gammaproteobacteria bacterium]
MNFGVVLVGDELLNGRRVDRHLAKVIKLLSERGLSLNWVRMVGDQFEGLRDCFGQTLATEDVVFSFGGIGATPDDITRQCAAAAAGVELQRHPDAQAEIEAQFGEGAYPTRILMADVPQGSRIIPNPINRVAGFSFARHHFVPGFPNMAWPMIEWVLDHEYGHLFHQQKTSQRIYQLSGAFENLLVPHMERLLKLFPAVSLSSLPNTEERRQIEFSLKGTHAEVEKAGAWIEPIFDQLQIRWRLQADHP